jgi:hypothetical protein
MEATMKFLSHHVLALVAGLAIVFVAPTAESAQDTVTVGTAAGIPGSTVSVPISVLDISGTPLGVDKPAGQRIQAFSITVTCTPAAAVSTLTLTRAGVTASLMPVYEVSSVEGNSVSYLASFSEVGSPIPLTQPGSPPGDQVLVMSVTIASGASPGSSIGLVLDARSTLLANQQGSVEESVANCTLTLSSGTITVNQAPAITSADHVTFSVGLAGTFTVTTTGFPTGASMAISETGGLPSSVTFTDNHDGTATLAGTPGAGTAGAYPLTLTAHNGVGSDATQSFSLAVQDCYALTTLTSPDGIGSVTVNTAPNCGSNYGSGTAISLTAVPPLGYTFGGWSGSGGTFSSLSALTTTFTITGTASVTARFNPVVAGALFHTLTPCRILDTRVATGPTSGAPLAAGQRYLFTTTGGSCGVPSGAVAIVSNLTVVNSTAAGELKVMAGSLTSTNTSAISFGLSRARANNAIVQLATDGSGTISVINNSAGTVHFILDVNGYFQ